MEYTIHHKEKFYFKFMIIISILMCLPFLYNMELFLAVIKFYPYVGLIALYCVLTKAYFVGHIKGNGVKVSEKQLPEIYASLKKLSEKLNLETVPDLYLLQGNGILNAFALRFSGKDKIVLYSSVVEAAYQEGMPAVEFILGHELGHIVRNHVGLSHLLILPAKMIPLLGSAYSRACEYTCDNIGYALSPEGAEKGLLILAVGTTLYNKININELTLNNALNENSFSVSFNETFSSHPHLLKRIAAIEEKKHLNNLAQKIDTLNPELRA